LPVPARAVATRSGMFPAIVILQYKWGRPPRVCDPDEVARIGGNHAFGKGAFFAAALTHIAGNSDGLQLWSLL
jgi:hypothetical protein